MDRTLSRSEAGVFFGLVFLLSLPFWVLGAVSDATVTDALSVASLMVVAPFLAAVILTWRAGGRWGVRALLARAVDPRLPRGARWYLPVLLLMPAAILVEVGLLHLMGREVPGFEVDPLVLIADLALFWVAATLEEIGWTGYATDRLLTSRSALATALVLGVAWALWHVIAMLEMPAGHSWAWVVLQGTNQIIVRILIVWIYVASGGSLFAAIGLHALLNVATMTLFPVYGSHYDPLVASVVLGVAAVVVVRLWGSSTLASLRLTIRKHRPVNRSGGSMTQRRGRGYVALGLVLGPALGYAAGRGLGDPDIALLTAGFGAALALLFGSALAALVGRAPEHARQQPHRSPSAPVARSAEPRVLRRAAPTLGRARRA